MSLGIGRKRSHEGWYELSETVANPERASEDTRRLSENPQDSTHDLLPTRSSTTRQDSLPPYIPPPAPAMVRNGRPIARGGSRSAQNAGRRQS